MTNPLSVLTTRTSHEVAAADASGAASESPARGAGSTRRDLYAALFRHKRKMALFFLASAGAIALGLAVCPRVYRSEARLFVRLGRESVALDPTATTGAMVAVNMTRDAEINSAIEVITSSALLEKVVDRVDPTFGDERGARREKKIARLAKNLDVWSPKNTTVIGISSGGPSPERARQIVSTLVEEYLAEHSRIHATTASHEFFNEQSELLRVKLEEATAALRDAKSRHNIATVDGRQNSLETQISSVETEIGNAQSARSASEAKIARIRSTLDQLPEPVVKQFAQRSTRGESTAREQLYIVQIREQELLSKYTEQHPEVIALREQVRAAERILRREQPDRIEATSVALVTEQANLASLRAMESSLVEQLARLRGELGELNTHEVEIRRLEREVNVTEENYIRYAGDFEQTRVGEALRRDQISNISVVQPASLVTKPVSPKTGLTLAAGLLAALVGAIGLAFVCEYLDHTLKSPEDVQTWLRLPALASIPQVPVSGPLLRTASYGVVKPQTR